MSFLSRQSIAGVRLLALCTGFFVTVSHGQNAGEPPAADSPPQISDEPKTVDPATLVPEKLSKPATIDFSDSTLREIAEWVEQEQDIPVLFDRDALSSSGIPLGEPITDHITNAPVYLLLNRLRSLGLTWFVRDDVLHITTLPVAEERMLTQSYSVGDLFDAGYKPQELASTILESTEGPWMEDSGEGGGIEWLGDVLFVRQTDQQHREIAGLLAALRKHGRQTLTLDPPQHIAIRQKLDEAVSVRFAETPLVVAIQQLAKQTGVDMRLNIPALREKGVREREPVSLALSDRKLSTVLRVLLAGLDLTWTLRDGVLWITSTDEADENEKTAVYDVRDLCRDENECDELTNALISQTAGPWEIDTGDGGAITFPKTGTMVIRQTEDQLREVQNLLENYRKALRGSKPRARDEADPKEILTRYYRMHDSEADSLFNILQKLVEPNSWIGSPPDGTGWILKVAAGPEPTYRSVASTQLLPQTTTAELLPRAVLIIRHTRAAHEQIAEILRRIQNGDPSLGADEFEGGGFGGGGFGGGYLQK